MKCEKPEFTEEMRDRLNRMYFLLKERYYTKQELMEIFGLGEEEIDNLIKEISHRYPIVSKNNTYKLATSIEDLDDLQNTFAHLIAEVEEIEKQVKVLIKFRNKYI